MNDITQIRVGTHMTGIIGLKPALAAAAERCAGMTDELIGDVLVEILGTRNYIQTGLRDVYAQAFVLAFKKYIGAPVTETGGPELTIKVLGPGCPQCDRLEQEVMTVMSETGITAELEHVRDVVEIAKLGVMGVPALMINGQVKAVGSVPPRGKIKAWIVEADIESKESE